MASKSNHRRVRYDRILAVLLVLILLIVLLVKCCSSSSSSGSSNSRRATVTASASASPSNWGRVPFCANLGRVRSSRHVADGTDLSLSLRKLERALNMRDTPIELGTFSLPLADSPRPLAWARIALEWPQGSRFTLGRRGSGGFPGHLRGGLAWQ